MRDPWSWLTDERLTRALKLLMVLVLAAFLGRYLLDFLGRIHAIVYILIGSIFFAYLIYPIVGWLAKRMPKVVALLVVYAGLLGAAALAGIFLVPHVVEEIGQLIQQYPDTVARVNAMVNDPNDPLLSQLPPWMRVQVVRVPDEVIEWVKVHGVETVGRAVVVLMGTFALIATFVIIPLFTAYLLLDLDHLKEGLFTLIPERQRKATFDLLHDVDHVFGGFVRGQLLVALAVGVLITIAMMLLHVRYAFLLGLLAAIGDLIPFVGALIAFIPAITTALIVNGWVNAIFVLVVFVVIFQVEGHIIAPNIVSKQVSLSPFIVMLALLIGGDLGGLVGMLVAVPVAGILRTILVRVFPAQTKNEAAP